MKDKNQVFYDKGNGRIGVMTVNDEPTMTQQQYKEECDINNIMKKYADTGVFTHVTSKKGMYGDFSEIQNYQGMLDTVQRAQDAFMTLPADVRARFRNDPGYLLDFLGDQKNYDEALKLGLVNKRETLDVEPQKINDIQNDKKIGDTKKQNTKKDLSDPSDK